MQNRSILHAILVIVGLVAVTLGAYVVADIILTEPAITFSTSFLDGDVTPAPLPNSEPNSTVELQGRIRSFAISPDGKMIAIATSKGTELYDLASLQQLRVLSDEENNFTVDWSLDGKELVVGSLIMQSEEVGKPHIAVWDASTWNIIFEPKLANVDSTMFLGTAAWSPNGRFLSTSDYERGLVTFDINTGKIISTQTDFLLPPYDIAWSPNGSRVVATGDLGYGFRRWRIDNDWSVRLYDSRVAAFATQLAWSPDGKRIASVHANGTVCFWTASTNQCDGFIKAHFDQAVSLAWSPDGNQLATGGGVIRIWDTHTGKQMMTFGLQENHLYSQLEWLPDGTLVSLETGYGEPEPTIIRFWEIATGTPLMEFRGASGRYSE